MIRRRIINRSFVPLSWPPRPPRRRPCRDSASRKLHRTQPSPRLPVLPPDPARLRCGNASGQCRSRPPIGMRSRPRRDCGCCQFARSRNTHRNHRPRSPPVPRRTASRPTSGERGAGSRNSDLSELPAPRSPLPALTGNRNPRRTGLRSIVQHHRLGKSSVHIQVTGRIWLARSIKAICCRRSVSRRARPRSDSSRPRRSDTSSSGRPNSRTASWR